MSAYKDGSPEQIAFDLVQTNRPPSGHGTKVEIGFEGLVESMAYFIKTLQDKIKDRDADNYRLSREMDALQTVIDEFDAARYQLMLQNSDLTEEIKRLEEDVVYKKNQVFSLQDLVSSLSEENKYTTDPTADISVICKNCGTFYVGWFPCQANACASITYEKEGIHYLVCCYGSVFDTNMYIFNGDPPPNFINANPICDNCVKYLISNNFITFDSEGHL